MSFAMSALREEAGRRHATSHVFRKTCATILDEAGMTPRMIADQLGHSRPSITQGSYLGCRLTNGATAEGIEGAGIAPDEDLDSAFPAPNVSP